MEESSRLCSLTFTSRSFIASVIVWGGMGYVNPRAMVEAQLECVGEHDAHIVPKTAMEIEATMRLWLLPWMEAGLSLHQKSPLHRCLYKYDSSRQGMYILCAPIN
jgi:hypothetical protein